MTSFIASFVSIIMAVFYILGIIGSPTQLNLENKVYENVTIDTQYTEETGTADRIHFLNTGSGNCIVIESNGRFAMLDAAEDNDNPKGLPSLDLVGYEEEILEYLKANCADENGKVTLDWVLGTHAHSDHLGGFDTIINDEDVTVKKAFLKKYDASKCVFFERWTWDNEEVYNQMIEACEANGVELIQDIPTEPFAFGDFTIQFFSTDFDEAAFEKEENANSVVTLVEKAGRTALCTGDLDWFFGDEMEVAKAIGKEIDILELGHHGYIGSSAPNFVKTLKPEVAIACNTQEGLTYSTVIKAFSSINCPIFPTVENDGIITYFTDDGRIILADDIICSQQLG